jgi:OmpA-OmpF porin, OOP family
MKNLKFIGLSSLLLLTVLTTKAQGDAEGCSDYPLFNRMPDFKISECESKEFDAFKFPVENTTDESGKTETVEGKYFYYYYELTDEKKEQNYHISALQIFRNFENALRQAKATIVAKVVEPGNSYSFITAKVLKNNMEIWVWIGSSEDNYSLKIVEREAMKQVIQANEMWDALNKDGFIALDILFDTGKSTIKEESLPIIDQMYDLLNSNPSLNVSIEGHTDNVGTPESNKTLSESRAKAVMDALAAKGINKSRLSSVGWGQERPVADNRTEEGKAKNRRVELVKK